MLDELREKVEQTIAPVVTETGLELVELNLGQRQSVYTVEVLADRPSGGITLEECATVNKKIVEVLDLTQILADNYELVVASPGLDRPLQTEKDFRRVMGQRVRFVLTERVGGKGEYSGTVKETNAEEVLVVTSKREIPIPLSKILKAVQII